VKRVMMPLTPMFLVPDDTSTTDIITLTDKLTRALLDLGAEVVSVSRSSEAPVAEGTCRVDGHTFYAPHTWPAERTLPDICPDHARQAGYDADMAEHAPLFDAISELSGGKLKAYLWHSGGGVMTIVVPWNEPAPGTDWQYPLYMGLKEGEDEETGDWYGSVGFYATEEDDQNGGEDIVTDLNLDSHGPRAWAQAIVTHYNAHQEAQK
jgi:hypothetical protein